MRRSLTKKKINFLQGKSLHFRRLKQGHRRNTVCVRKKWAVKPAHNHTHTNTKPSAENYEAGPEEDQGEIPLRYLVNSFASMDGAENEDGILKIITFQNKTKRAKVLHRCTPIPSLAGPPASALRSWWKNSVSQAGQWKRRRRQQAGFADSIIRMRETLTTKTRSKGKETRTNSTT